MRTTQADDDDKEEDDNGNRALAVKLVCGAKVMVALACVVMVCTVTMTIICETSYGTDLHDNC